MCGGSPTSDSAFSYVMPGLAPTPLAEDVSPMPMLPAMVNPASTAPRRRCPSACIPGVSIPVPPMISALPNITWTGRHAPRLYDRNRRCNPNHYLRGGCTESERTRENQTKQSFTQHTSPYPRNGANLNRNVPFTGQGRHVDNQAPLAVDGRFGIVTVTTRNVVPSKSSNAQHADQPACLK